MKHSAFLPMCILLALCSSSQCLSQTSDRRDGNWWISQSRGDKLEYTVGFFDGMVLGHNFSYWAFMDSKNKESCLNDVSDSYSTYSNKFLSDVTNYQLVDGLDSLYSDYRNRRIMVFDGVWLVLNGIAGTPQAELNKMIENWRKNAVHPEN